MRDPEVRIVEAVVVLSASKDDSLARPTTLAGGTESLQETIGIKGMSWTATARAGPHETCHLETHAETVQVEIVVPLTRGQGQTCGIVHGHHDPCASRLR
jgi:hypothetical protein